MTTMTTEQLAAWFAGRLPDGWFTGRLAVRVDREEIQVVGELPTPDVGEEAGDDERVVARRSRVAGFREDTREQRMAVADEAEHLFGRKVSWGARCDGEEHLFTTAAVPVMTRLRMDERAVLDTLIDGGVARSRSEALAWCVRLVGRHQGDWIAELREALAGVERVRAQGPDAAS